MLESREIVLPGHLRFEVLPNVGRMEVHCGYSSAMDSDSHLSGGSTLDIGIFVGTQDSACTRIVAVWRLPVTVTRVGL
jgi:hypothetical protein